MNITVAIPTCIYPRGCKLGVDTALAETVAAQGRRLQVSDSLRASRCAHEKGA